MRIGECRNREELVVALETVRQRRLELRRGYETIWWNNIALVAGDHYATWNPTTSQFEDKDLNFLPDGQKKPRMVINHALTVARTELSKLTKARPIMEIIANSDEQTDIAATKVGRAALDYAEWKFRLRKHRKSALWWMIQTGLGAVFVGYDYMNDKAGNMTFLIDPATGEPTFSPIRRQQLQQRVDSGELDKLDEENFPMGEVEYKTYSPFQLLPDETVLEFSEIRDLITEDVVNIDVLRGLYPKARDLSPDGDLHLGTMERRMMARMGVVSMRPEEQQVTDANRVHTFWLLPNTYRGNKFLEKGLMLRWAKGRTILDYTEIFPFEDARMPFVFFQHIPTSTSIWPDCVMNHIRGPNLEIDKTVSQLIENKDYMANPMWRVATQHRIKTEIKNVAGGVVRYRHVPNVPPPEPIQGIQMPAQVESILAGLREQILDISGQSEVARGRVPTGVRSGVAVAYLQEEDDTKIAPTIENMEEEIALMGSLTLERFSQYYVLPRILRFYRRDGMFDVLKFKGADLKNNTDVICQAGSAMPRSKAARQQYVLELVSLGVKTDPHWVIQALELGEGEPDDTDKSIAQANRENNYMMYGTDIAQAREPRAGEVPNTHQPTAVPVKKWHNHQVHIQRHTSVMMDEDFDRLTITRPEVVRLFDEHVAMHQQYIAQAEQAQLQQIMAMKGSPDGPPQQGGDGGPGNFNFNRSMSDVPDVIGKGVTRLTAMRSTPQGAGGQ